MAITKPSWIRNLLDRLNWDIFSWKIYVGDAVESAIDWAIGWINWGIYQAERAYTKAWDAWDKALDVFYDLTAKINREVQSILNQISAWWSDLSAWWSAKVTWILDLVGSFYDTLRDMIGFVNSQLTNLSVAWDSFWRVTLPGLLSIDRWTAFWGGAIANISEWWGARLAQVTDLIELNVKPVRDELNKRLELFDFLAGLVSDPLSWKDTFTRRIVSWIENIIARLL